MSDASPGQDNQVVPGGASGGAPLRPGLFRSRIAPLAVALALTAGAGALVIVPNTDTVEAVALSDRTANTVARPVAQPQLGAASVAPTVVADWAKAEVDPLPKPKPVAPKPVKRATVTPDQERPAKRAARADSAPKASATKKAKKVKMAKRVTRAKKVKAPTRVKVKVVKKARVSKAPKPTRSYSGRRVLGLQPSAMVVYNAVMSRWGGRINTVGGYRSTSRSVHQYGLAIDFMLTPRSESAMGWSIARYVAANAGTFKVDHIIFEQKIWTPYRPVWRPMEDRGSITQNHYDHVHVAVKR